MDASRGRSPSRGNAQHMSRQPSPNQYNTSVPGVIPSVQAALTTGKFTNSQSFAGPFFDPQQQSGLQSGPTEQAFYADNQYQTSFQDNQFAGQAFDPSFNNNFIYPAGNMSNDFQNYSMSNTYDMNPQANINPADLSKVSSPHDQQSPGLQPPENLPSQPGSPASTNGQFYTPQHSRHASLDPASAYGDGFSGMNFQQHRRAPSDHSEISSASHSPYLGHAELHETSDLNHSPFLQAQPDTNNAFGMESFSLAEQASYRSPRLMPHMEGTQQGLGVDQGLTLNQPMGIPIPNVYTSQAPAYPSIVPSNHIRNTSVVSEIGQADQFAPPTINIEPAPVSRQQSFGPQGELLEGALSPPTSSRGRSRSKSDVTFSRPLSRAGSPGLTSTNNLAVSRSPERGGTRSLSRESSPGPVASGRIEKNRRASTSSLGQTRDYILDLADPDRPNASPTGQSTRVQKHPATFQCNLCPKRFTRAYNLRSHLRTHTDERPFVCTVCGKAFARQHDRKRHEGLHSGEKKFVCRGELHTSPGQHWGCGRRFARADALGRHFRSEAGRICIKPLLEEEKAERQNRAMMEQQQHQQVQYAQNSLQPLPQPMMIGMDPSTGTGGFALPAALLQQYPALQNIDWSQISGVDDQGDLSDVGGMGRASFDGSSGGEYYDEEISDGYVSGSGLDFSNPGPQMYMQ
ncbi:DNA-binding transcription factor [Exophiala xenobiotica]|nr:DNA-binding transcription factor [Exophiala xenobiotica]